MSIAAPTSTTDPTAILARQSARESSARTYARSLPIVPVRASGTIIEGANGRRYLDCLSGAGALALGHNHPVVVEAIRATLERGAPLQVLDVATPEKDAFIDALFATLPTDLARHGRIHFCGPTGADAVEAALKLSRAHTGRNGVLAFTGAYHGQTAGALAATGAIGPKMDMPPGDVTRLPFPYSYRCPFGVGGDASGVLSSAYIERLLDDPNGGVTPPAAMIVEPVQGEGGVVPAPPGWLSELRRITTRHNIPLIVDEVQTGAGRTGALWACEHDGVVPDVLVASKAIGGSLPLAVIVYRGELDGWLPGTHTGTFRGNQLALAAGTATLRHIVAERLDARAAELGNRLLGALQGLQSSLPIIGEVRGRGLMLGLELVDPTAERDTTSAAPPAPWLAARVRAECLDRGLIVELGGRHDTVVRLLPPLTISDEEVDSVLDRLSDALSVTQAAAELVP